MGTGGESGSKRAYGRRLRGGQAGKGRRVRERKRQEWEAKQAEAVRAARLRALQRSSARVEDMARSCEVPGLPGHHAKPRR